MKGIRGFVAGVIMGGAGATTDSPNRILLLRDTDGDGNADKRTVFLSGLNSPFGMTLIGNDFYVAGCRAAFCLSRRRYLDFRCGHEIVDLPAARSTITGPRTSSPAATAPSSMSRSARTPMSARTASRPRPGRAAIWEVDLKTGRHRILRLRTSAIPTAWTVLPCTDTLWVTVNERDEIGSDLVPDYMDRVKDGGFYGWPYSYYGQHVDVRMQPQRARTWWRKRQRPITRWAPTPPRSAWSSPTRRSLGRTTPMASSSASTVVNRNPRAGYRVIFVPFAGRQAERRAERGPDRLPVAGRARPRPPRRRGHRQVRRAAGGRRCRRDGVCGSPGNRAVRRDRKAGCGPPNALYIRSPPAPIPLLGPADD